MEYFYVVAGLVLLILSGNYLINGATQIARYFKLSSLVIGATVVAFGTSAPELIVSIQSAMSGHPDFAIGNVIGSNIVNIALILGITAVMLPIVIQNKFILRDWIFMMVASVLLFLFIIDDNIARYEGGILIAGLIYFTYRTIHDSRKSDNQDEILAPTMKLWVSILLVIGSSIGLALGADWLVDGASQIAKNFGVSEKIISITLVAFGTSIPELTASVVAAIKKETDISIANIIGSNIFNIFAVIGISSVICPIQIGNFLMTYLLDIIVLFVISIILIITISPVKNDVLTRSEGCVLLLSYAVYMYLLFAL